MKEYIDGKGIIYCTSFAGFAMAIHTGGGEPNHFSSIDAVLAEIEAFTADAAVDLANESYVSAFFFSNRALDPSERVREGEGEGGGGR